MLVLGTHGPIGNMLHIVYGPETDMYLDVHGVAMVEITGLLKAIAGTEHKTFVAITRCRSEVVTQQMLSNSEVSHLSSFKQGLPVLPPQTQPPTQPQPTAQPVPIGKTRCAYCGGIKELLSIPGFKICSQCAQIELGVKKTAGKALLAKGDKRE